MRDGTRQAGDRRRAEALADGVVQWLDGDGEQVDGRSQGRQVPPEDDVPNASERLTLIEFLWEGQTGAQQVILVAREWLQ